MGIEMSQLHALTRVTLLGLAAIAAGQLLTACGSAEDPGLESPLAISAGADHTCAVTSVGGVKCWGYNWAGQLGNGTTGDSSKPLDVSGLVSGVRGISAGGLHTCALTDAGGVKCWGSNAFGRLGTGTEISSSTPVDVIGLGSNVRAISVGVQHTCAVTDAGGVKCWGVNWGGQLGNGVTTDTLIPVDVSGLDAGVSAISVGLSHSCALTKMGGVKCWGDNNRGQLGEGTTTSSATPVGVSALGNDVRAIAAGGSHTCVLTNAGSVKCWGANQDGQLGNGTKTSSSTAVDAIGLTSSVSAISAGSDHTCVITSAGGAKCWGQNEVGRLADGATSDGTMPADVDSLSSDVSAISAGGGHTCVLTRTGGAKCWGYRKYGALGDGAALDYTIPVDVRGLASGVSAIAASGWHTCALTSVGGVKCWGYNNAGEMGTGDGFPSFTPVDVIGLDSGITAISAGADYSCALTSLGGVKCWGWAYEGPGGRTPMDVLGLASGVSAIGSGGSSFTCVLTSAGGVKCWGTNWNGELGNGTATPSTTPVGVSGLSSGVSAVSQGGSHACALTNAGGAKCWGSNRYGELGNGTTTSSTIPVDVSGLSSGLSAISAGIWHTCALTSAGGVKCWGSGLLGDGTMTDSAVPVDVVGLGSGVTAVAAGFGYTCAMTELGGVKCWGNNAGGQLGNGTTTDSTTPVPVSGLNSGVRAISAGDLHTCALTSSGGVKCWGFGYASLGDKEFSYVASPVDVVGLAI